MANLRQYEFFLLRYVPDPVKQEFVNVGLVMLENNGGKKEGQSSPGFAAVKFTRDWSRVRCLDAGADLETLQALEADLREQLSTTGDRNIILEKIKDSFSNIIQVSDPKACLGESPTKQVDLLAKMYLEQPPRKKTQSASRRQMIYKHMRDAFIRQQVWDLMWKQIPVARYTRSGDPLKIDCGYRPNGKIRLFHAVSIESEPDVVKSLAFSYPQIAAGIQEQEHAATELTAVIEDDLNRNDETVAFGLETFERQQIKVATLGEIHRWAEIAREEMRV